MSRARGAGRKAPAFLTGEDASVLIVESSRVLASAVAARCNQIDGLKAEVAADFAYAQELVKYDPERFCAAVVGLVLPDAPEGAAVDLATALDIPTIVLTSTQSAGLRDDMLSRGAADYVLKSGQAGLDYVVRMVERLADLQERRILIVDDSSTYRAYAEKLLHQHGYRTISAENGAEGLKQVADNRDISLVITDYNMPVMDGLEMTERLRKTYGHDKLAIIALSDASNPDLLVQFLKTGATDYVNKSASVEEFFCRIDQNIDVLRNLTKARDAAYVDFLTKLPNRRCFFEQGSLLYSDVSAQEGELLIAMLDIDHFKSINDTYGHEGGDYALVALAQTLHELITHENALVARMGGEEFICFWNVDSCHDDEAKLEDLRQSIEHTVCTYKGQNIPITASIGATRWMGSSIDDMVNASDALMYQAKQAGRNCVRYSNVPGIGVQ